VDANRQTTEAWEFRRVSTASLLTCSEPAGVGVSCPSFRNRRSWGPDHVGEVQAADSLPGVRKAYLRAVEVRAGEVRTLNERTAEVCDEKVRTREVRGVEHRPG
jgi:hypothetical protein